MENQKARIGRNSLISWYPFVIIRALYSLFFGGVVIGGGSIEDCVSDLVDPGRPYPKFREFNISTKQYHINRIDGSINWCDSFWFCASRGQQLLTLKDDVTHDAFAREMEGILPDEKFVWLSARRKDYDESWTWVSNSLTGCGAVCTNLSKNGVDPFGTVFATMTKRHLIQGDSENKLALLVICKGHKGGTNETDFRQATSWYDAQNTCSKSGKNADSRLMTYGEIDELMNLPTKRYWIGLFFDPWLWIEGRDKHRYRPLLYFKSNLTMDAEPRECLGVNLTDFEWKIQQCDAKSQYVICIEDHNNNAPFTGAYNKAGVAIGPGILIILLTIAVILVLLKKTNKLDLLLRQVRSTRPTTDRQSSLTYANHHVTNQTADHVTSHVDDSYHNVVCGSGKAPRLPPEIEPLEYEYAKSIPKSSVVESRFSVPGPPKPPRMSAIVDEYSVVKKPGKRNSPGTATSSPGGASHADAYDAVELVDNMTYELSDAWKEEDATRTASSTKRKMKPKPKVQQIPWGNNSTLGRPRLMTPTEYSTTEHECGPEGDIYALVDKKKARTLPTRKQ